MKQLHEIIEKALKENNIESDMIEKIPTIALRIYRVYKIWLPAVRGKGFWGRIEGPKPIISLKRLAKRIIEHYNISPKELKERSVVYMEPTGFKPDLIELEVKGYHFNGTKP